MSGKQNKFDRLQVASPCTAEWETMSGNGQQRHCLECNKTVFDFSRLTPRQIDALIALRRGHLCARLTRREDGSLVTLEAPPIPLAPPRRPHAAASVLVSAMLGLSGPVTAQTVPQSPVQIESRRDQERSAPNKTPAGETLASLVGAILDPNQAAIPNVNLTLTNNATKETRLTKSSEKGQYRFSGLPEGQYTLRIQSPGFKTAVMEDIEIAGTRETNLGVTLEVGSVTMGIIISTPLTLRELYQQSDLIAVATVGQSRVALTDNDAKMMKTALHITTPLKGASRNRTVFLYHWANEETDERFRPGETLLAFLNQRKNDAGLPIEGFRADDDRGLKKLDHAALQSYRQRVEDLAQILHAQPADPAALVEWLVQCIEDPATRWEGAYDLARGVWRQLEEADTEEMPDETAQETEATDTESAAEEEEPEEEADASDFAKRLSESQKQRLANALFRTQILTENEEHLLEIVRTFNDRRLVPFLTAQLRHNSGEAPYPAADWIEIIAATLKDKTIEALAKEFEDINDPGDGNDPASAQAIARRRSLLARFIMAVESRMPDRN